MSSWGVGIARSPTSGNEFSKFQYLRHCEGFVHHQLLVRLIAVICLLSVTIVAAKTCQK